MKNLILFLSKVNELFPNVMIVIIINVLVLIDLNCMPNTQWSVNNKGFVGLKFGGLPQTIFHSKCNPLECFAIYGMKWYD